MTMSRTLLRIIPATAALLALALLPSLGRAQGLDNEKELQLCLCRNVLARTLCKEPDDFNYVASYRDGTHTFTVFYANKTSRVLCQVSDAFVHIKAELTQTLVRSVPYSRESGANTATVDYQVPECPANWTITCRAEMSPEDRKEQEEYDFWNRPLPDILKDELESGMAREQNATAPEDGPGATPEAAPSQ